MHVCACGIHMCMCIFICVLYVLVYMPMQVHMYAHVCGHMGMDTSSDSRGCHCVSSLVSTLIQRPELSDLVSLGNQLAFHILKLGLQTGHYIHQTFMWVLGVQSLVLTLAGQTL